MIRPGRRDSSTKRLRVARATQRQPLWGWGQPGRQAGPLHEAPARCDAQRNVSPYGAGSFWLAGPKPSTKRLRVAMPGATSAPMGLGRSGRAAGRRTVSPYGAGSFWLAGPKPSTKRLRVARAERWRPLWGRGRSAELGRCPPRSACALQCPAQRQPLWGWVDLADLVAAGPSAPMGLGFAPRKRGAAPLGLGWKVGADGRRAGFLHEAPAQRAKGGWFPGLGWSLCPFKAPV